jgi:hypothetical protein
MSRKITISVVLSIFIGVMLLTTVSVSYAEDGPRPTPTDIGTVTPPPETTPEPEGSSSNRSGNVRGFVYIDVNGDGQCMNTGIAGEEPAAGIPVEFVSSDEQYVFTHTSGEKGDFELAGAGQSNWRVTVKPGAEWVVTSENPQYGLVAKDHLSATDVNFCVSKGGVTAVYPMIAPLSVSDVPADSAYVLPEAGAPAAAPTTILWPLLLGLSLIVLGLGWRWYEVKE